MNEKLIRALKGKNSEGPPIWLMRQAGRYMPEYRAIRGKHSFLEMCRNRELITQITKLPIEVFDFDAAIIFSDILLILETFGVGLRFEEGLGPILEKPIHTPLDIAHLQARDLDQHIQPTLEAISILRKELKVPLIGFCGAPFTVASYLIEGKTSRDLKKTKQWMMREPDSFHKLLQILTSLSIQYLKKQIEAGAQAIQIFDSWASVLSTSQFHTYSLAYMQKIMDALAPTTVPVILFCRGSSVFAEQLASISPAGISLDWNGDIGLIRQKIPQSVALQGNLDPDILYAKPSTIKQEVQCMLNKMRQDPAYIFNLGHGISPDTPTDAVKLLVDIVKNNVMG